MGLLHPDIPAVRLLQKQVAEVGQMMLQQLLAKLRSSLQLPECLRTMGYLRRIAAFSEPELRLQFLSCRQVRELRDVPAFLFDLNAHLWLPSRKF